MKKQLTISGMHCHHCVHAVRQALSRIPGIDVIDVEIGSAEINGEIGETDAIAAALYEEGYTLVELVDAA